MGSAGEGFDADDPGEHTCMRTYARMHLGTNVRTHSRARALVQAEVW